MVIKFSPDVKKELRKIKQSDSRLFVQVDKQLTLFSLNPKHPSLRTHKLVGKLKNRWSISITRGFRMVYLILDTEEIYFVDIGTHDQVYR